MDGNSKVTCCFCGESLLYKDATQLIVQWSVESEEVQQLFCHKKHFIEHIHKSVPLYPDLL